MVKYEGEVKQVILVRMDLKLPKGKLAAQVAHASVETVWKTSHSVLEAWRAEGCKKVVLEVKDEKELIIYQKLARDAGLKSSLITDAGHTVVAPGTITCLGIGPDNVAKIDAVTGKLKML